MAAAAVSAQSQLRSWVWGDLVVMFDGWSAKCCAPENYPRYDGQCTLSALAPLPDGSGALHGSLLLSRDVIAAVAENKGIEESRCIGALLDCCEQGKVSADTEDASTTGRVGLLAHCGGAVGTVTWDLQIDPGEAIGAAMLSSVTKLATIASSRQAGPGISPREATQSASSLVAATVGSGGGAGRAKRGRSFPEPSGATASTMATQPLSLGSNDWDDQSFPARTLSAEAEAAAEARSGSAPPAKRPQRKAAGLSLNPGVRRRKKGSRPGMLA
jgi:hypothetical protein